MYAIAGAQRSPATAAVAEERDAARKLLDAAAVRAKSAGVEAETEVLEGSPAETLLGLAESRQADLIALGTHGRRGVRRLLFGSVAEERNAGSGRLRSSSLGNRNASDFIGSSQAILFVSPHRRASVGRCDG